MQEITLEAQARSKTGKTPRLTRREGNVPGIFYVRGENNISIAVPEKSLRPLIFTSETHIVNLKVDGEGGRNCILRDVQFDPVTDRPIHFDLQGLLENEEITIEVPIAITGGTPVGVRDGGILQQFAHRLRISCLPKHIPDHIEINASEIKVNHFIHVRDLSVPNIAILDNPNNTLVGVVPPTVEKEVTPTVAAAAAETSEPEVIGKGKKVEEGGEAAPGASGAGSGKEEKK